MDEHLFRLRSDSIIHDDTFKKVLKEDMIDHTIDMRT